MSYVIFGDSFTFPHGTAATNRVHTYARGFSEYNISVHVICFENEYLKINDGIIDGIHYYHPFGQQARNKHFLVRRWQKFIKYFKTIKLLRQINKDEKIIAINCWTQHLTTQIFIFSLAISLRTVLILERSEHPLRNYQKGLFRRIQGKARAYMEGMLCHGIYCISKYLVNFYKSQGLKPKNLLLVPSTVDTERFSKACEPPFDFPYILYCGSLTILKDGVDILLQSYEIVSEMYPEVRLVLTGKGDVLLEEQRINNLVTQLGLEDRVIFTGLLPREDIPRYMKNAKILALARPKSIVADAGFPSKLTEYLATGVPVIVTGVGEIPAYLSDKVNAFLAEPGDSNSFAQKIVEVLTDYPGAVKVGSKGKELTMNIFNYKYQAERMIKFISSIH